MKTREEIEKLKVGWRKDPCWDIEDSEGFEEHKEELLAYRKQVEVEVEQRVRASADQRAKKMKEETGITDPIAAQYLHTFAEIESDISRNAIGEASQYEMSMVELTQAQARATLLLAAQMRRIADVLEANDGEKGILVSTIGRYEH